MWKAFQTGHNTQTTQFMIEIGSSSVNCVVKVTLETWTWIKELSHIKRGVFKCYFCNKSLARKASLANHLKDVHSENTFECNFCSKKLKTKRLLQIHVNRIHLESYNWFHEIFCLRTFISIFVFLFQLTVIHPQQPQEPAKVSSSVDIQLEAKDSHFQVGVHGVEQPSYSVSSSDNNQSFFVAGAKDQSKFNSVANSKWFYIVGTTECLYETIQFYIWILMNSIISVHLQAMLQPWLLLFALVWCWLWLFLEFSDLELHIIGT